MCWVRNRRVLPHVGWLKHTQLMPAFNWNGIEPRDLYRFAGLYQPNDMNAEAEQMYVRALRGYEKA